MRPREELLELEKQLDELKRLRLSRLISQEAYDTQRKPLCDRREEVLKRLFPSQIEVEKQANEFWTIGNSFRNASYYMKWVNKQNKLSEGVMKRHNDELRRKAGIKPKTDKELEIEMLKREIERLTALFPKP